VDWGSEAEGGTASGVFAASKILQFGRDIFWNFFSDKWREKNKEK